MTCPGFQGFCQAGKEDIRNPSKHTSLSISSSACPTSPPFSLLFSSWAHQTCSIRQHTPSKSHQIVSLYLLSLVLPRAGAEARPKTGIPPASTIC
jgi:hypothetical protein